MQVKITYCSLWNYKPKAFRVKEEILSKFLDADVELIVGSGGNFIVEFNKKIVFSKKEVNRFPNDGEIINLISNLNQWFDNLNLNLSCCKFQGIFPWN